MKRNGIYQNLSPSLKDDAGDVPGWVLITVMTAGLVAALWVVAGFISSQVKNFFGSKRIGVVFSPIVGFIVATL